MCDDHAALVDPSTRGSAPGPLGTSAERAGPMTGRVHPRKWRNVGIARPLRPTTNGAALTRRVGAYRVDGTDMLPMARFEKDPGETGPRGAARLLGVDPSTVTRWADSGQLPVARRLPSGYRRYRVADVVALAERMTERGQ